MKKNLFLLLLMTLSLQCYAQFFDPVSVEHSTKIDGNNATLVFDAAIESGWHMYSANFPEGGPTVTKVVFETLKGAEVVGGLTVGEGEIEKFEDMFAMTVKYFEEEATFTQKLKLTGGEYVIAGYLEYGACNDETCSPPSTYDFEIKGDAPVVKEEKPAAKETKPVVKEEKTAVKEVAKPSATEVVKNDAAPIVGEKQSTEADVPAAADEKPVTEVSNEEKAVDAPASIVKGDSYLKQIWSPVVDMNGEAHGANTDGVTSSSVLAIFFMGFVGGLLALLTPCVWPIIPMTVSFFLKRSKERSKAIKEALIYGVSIVVIYLLLGILVTVIFGANALNALSTNAFFNILFFLMLVLFGASFLGGFEITLPSSWTNKVDNKASSTTGLLSIFLMAFTLALVSFSCTGPIIGFLLVEVATTGSLLGPIMGMFGFALALALPFTFFAIFPSLLKQVPRSGGWMNTIKVVLGFVELAFALKFLSVADLAYGWGILDRETFLAIWIVLFALLGLYLLKVIRFPHDDPEEKVTSVPGFFMALISLAFAVYLVPGLWGAPCSAVSAFAPPMSTQDFNLVQEEQEVFNDYEEGMRYAKEHGKPVFLDFTGHGCVNCREMEADVLSNRDVKEVLKEFVIISLYVDDKTALDEQITVEINGKSKKLRTVGDKWSYLQAQRFKTNSQPFYVPLDNEGNPLNGSFAHDVDVEKFLTFLDEAVKNYNKR